MVREEILEVDDGDIQDDQSDSSIDILRGFKVLTCFRYNTDW